MADEPTSGRATWAKVPAELARRDVSRLGYRVFIALSAHAGGVDRLAWVSQEALGAELSADGQPVHRRSVRRGLQELAALGLIRPAGRTVFPDGHWVNRYLVAPFDGAAGAPSAVGADTAPTRDGAEGAPTPPLADPAEPAESASFPRGDGAVPGIPMAQSRAPDGAAGAPRTDPVNRPVPEQREQAAHPLPGRPHREPQGPSNEVNTVAPGDGASVGDGGRPVWDQAFDDLEAILPEGPDARDRPGDAFLRLARSWVQDPDPRRYPLRVVTQARGEVRRGAA